MIYSEIQNIVNLVPEKFANFETVRNQYPYLELARIDSNLLAATRDQLIANGHSAGALHICRILDNRGWGSFSYADFR